MCESRIEDADLNIRGVRPHIDVGGRYAWERWVLCSSKGRRGRLRGCAAELDYGVAIDATALVKGGGRAEESLISAYKSSSLNHFIGNH